MRLTLLIALRPRGSGLLPLLATRIPGLCPWSARLRLLLTVLWSRVAWLWAWVARLWLLLA